MNHPFALRFVRSETIGFASRYIAWRGLAPLLLALLLTFPLPTLGGDTVKVVTATPVSYSFGPVVVGEAATTVVTVFNGGNTAALYRGFKLGGISDGFRAITSCGIRIFAFDSCQFTLSFEPRYEGFYEAELYYFLGDCAPCTIYLSGLGASTGPRAMFIEQGKATTELKDENFGPVPIYESSKKSIHLRSIGSEPLTFANILIGDDNTEFEGKDASQFLISSTTCGPTLYPGQACTVDVNFLPTSPGSKSSALIAVTNDPSLSRGRRRVSIHGFGTQTKQDPNFGCATPGSCTGQVSVAVGTKDNAANGVLVGNDGKLTVSGFSQSGSNMDFSLFQLTPDGAFDSLFGQNGSGIVPPATPTGVSAVMYRAEALGKQNNPHLLVAGTSVLSTDGSNPSMMLRRYNPDGSADSAFGTNGTVIAAVGRFSAAKAMAIQADDKPVIAGTSSAINSTPSQDVGLVRFNRDGTLDTSFGTGGMVTTAVSAAEDTPTAIALQPDGKIVVAGRTMTGTKYNFMVLRYNADGNLDASFGTGGKVILSFGANHDRGNALALQADGKLIVAGISYNPAIPARFALARLNSDGSLDTTFGSAGKVLTTVVSGAYDSVNSLAMQADGKIVAAGYTYTTQYNIALARYNPDGSLDTNFGTNGLYTTNVGAAGSVANLVKIQPDGRLIVAGYAYNGTATEFAVLRLLTDAPGAKFTSDVLNFAAQAVGSASTAQTVMFSNPGEAPLPIASISAMGDFSQSNNCPSVLDKRASCTITVYFTPTSSGSRYGSVVIVHTLTGAPTVLPLIGTASGSGTAPGARLAPDALKFADQNLLAASSAQTVLLTNYGSDTLAIASLTASGDFAQTNDCGSSLAAGASCTISVTVTPTAAGPLTGVLTVTSNTALSPQTLALAGAGVAVPVVGLSTASLALGSAAVGTNSALQSVTVSNTGTGPLSIYSIFTTLDYTNTTACGTALAIGASCTIGVFLSPTSEDDLPGWLLIDTNAPGTPGLVTLSGTGTPGTATTTTTSTTTTSTAGSTTTTTGSTSTTTASTTTTTLGGSVALNFVSGWNLVGNSSSGALDVAATFGDANKVTTVWKWVVSKLGWGFYTPSQGDGGAAYAQGKGYDFLVSIAGGEGFWVNAKTPFTAVLPAGTAISSASFQSMASGWNLIAIGDNLGPFAFNSALTTAQVTIPEVSNFTSLWAWDATKSNWYFFAPSMVWNGTLANFIASKNYLDFGTKTLDPGMGFWVNKP